jgi:hypothetical protein
VDYRYTFERPITIKTSDLDGIPVTANYNQTLFVVSVNKVVYVTTSELQMQLVPGLKYRLRVRDKSLMVGIKNPFIMKVYKCLGGIPLPLERG